MRVFLSGPMGSGKSTLGKALAERAGLPAFDLDTLIEQQTGSDVSALFAARGEAAFREIEATTLHALLAQHARGVFALGGGTVTNHALRRELLREGTLITLRAPVAELARRVGSGAGRPLLAGQDVATRLAALLEQRADAYAECHAVLETNGRGAADLAAEALRIVADAPIVVPLGTRSYRVEVGRGVRARLSGRVSAVARSARVALVSDDVVSPLWGEPLTAALRDAGRDVVPIVLSAGEQHKTLRSVEQIWEAALQAGLDRGAAFIGVGGGVVGDLSAFAASTFLRGVAAGHVPTTLLAMVDSAIGGKTGFDTRHGKNLIGSFHQPSFVLCDVDVLATLPAAERTAGLAEVIKSAWIDGEASVAMLERDRDALRAGEADATVRAIRMSAALKARIVTEDEREAGARALLNLGHTLGHAIEASLGYAGLRHGEAVALGMVAAFRVSMRAGLAAAAEAERATRLLADLGLPTDVGPYLNPRVLSFIGADKKRRADSITFVLPAAPGRVELRPLPIADLPGLLAG